MKTKIKEINPQFYDIENLNIHSTTEELMANLSDGAKLCLMKLGQCWKQAGLFGRISYITEEQLRSLLQVPNLFTINKFKEYSSSYGSAGIKNTIIPYFIEANILELWHNRFDEYVVTPHGRELLNSFCIDCAQCKNTRICTNCNNWEPDICEHTLTSNCTSCKKTGKMTCDWCVETTEETGVDSNPRSQVNDMHQRCRKCHDERIILCNICVRVCDKCDENSLVKCYSCDNTKKCRSCEEFISIIKEGLR